MTRRVAVAVAILLLIGPLAEPSSAAAYDTACDGASEETGAFVDAGLAADCLKLYELARGKADGSFGERDALLRSQVSSLLARLVNLGGVGLSQRRSFPDVNPDSVPNAQVRDEIELLAGSGIIAGLPDGTFGPTLTLTVAQAATLVVRALQFIDAAKPSAPDVRDQGSTQANYDYAVGITLLNRAAQDINGANYPAAAGDGTARGLLADMLAVSIEALVDTGITNSRSKVFSFGDGQYRVGSQIPAGTYRAKDTSQSCYWERESGFSGSLDDVIANNITSGGPEIVTINSTDAGFKSNRCIRWSNNLAPLKSPTSPIPPGAWQVNNEIAPGTYTANATGGSSCYWERLSGFSGELKDIIDNGISSSTQIVTISQSDVGFRTHRCTNWVPG
jgi:hypothetical protein